MANNSTRNSSPINLESVPGGGGYDGRRRLHVGFGHDDFHSYFLERELIVYHAEQLECARVGHVGATQLDPGRSAGEVRIRFRHFAIEQKRNISVKSLL